MNKREGISSLSLGGFRKTWLVPVDAVVYGLIVTVGLKYGLAIAMALIFVPYILTLKKIAKDPIQTKATALMAFSKLATLPYSIAIRLRKPKSHTRPAVSLAH